MPLRFRTMAKASSFSILYHGESLAIQIALYEAARRIWRVTGHVGIGAECEVTPLARTGDDRKYIVSFSKAA